MIISQHKKALEDYFDKNYELESLLASKGKDELLSLINAPKEMAHYTFIRQMQALGTAHAVGLVEYVIPEDYFIVIFGDAIYPPEMFTDLLQKFAEVHKPIICAHQVAREDVSKYGVIQKEGDRMLNIVEQPARENAPSNLVCNGVYLLPKSIFALIKQTPINVARGEYLLPDALNMLMQQDEVYVLETRPFWDIGSIDLWMKANAKLYTDGHLFD